MKRKIVFIAHPIAGDVEGNIRRVVKICKQLHSEKVIPIALYVVSLQYLDDGVEADRALGIVANLMLFRRRFVDELWLFGDRISKGMKQEIRLALKLGIPVVPKTAGTRRDFKQFTR